jgi:hypothetical protein
VSLALFDLGQRLHAATLGQPVARCCFVPVLPPVEPIAVTVTGAGEGALVRASDAMRQTAASGPGALSALVDLGLGLGPEPRTVVVLDRGSLDRLLELARHTSPTSANWDVAATVGWWDQRADHPGTGAVLDLTLVCAERWVLGVAPADEHHLRVWRHWLRVAEPGPQGLLELADLVAAGETLPGLETFAEDDRRSWDYFRSRTLDPANPWDWRTRDNRREAALGLATRNDAAELYASLRLADPLVAQREAFGGMVVSGIVQRLVADAVIEVSLDRLVCRLRADTAVEGYPGEPGGVPTRSGLPWLRSRVGATRVTADEHLIVTLNQVQVRGSLRRGQRLTLRPRAVDPNQQRSGRHELHRRYATRRSWLSGGSAPTPHRRDVPLDIVIGAAEP